MKKYIMTAPAFTGEIRVLYGEDEKLLHIDFANCDMTDDQIAYFKHHLPVTDPKDFKAVFPKSKLTVSEEGYTVTFDEFWTEYDQKRNKQRSLKLWDKLSKADQVRAYFGLKRYHRFLQLNQWRTKAEPDTYLKNRYWENEWK